jgi:general secretion pathway protein F
LSSNTLYSFRAVRADGGIDQGVLEAASREAAVALIASRGVYPVEIERQSHRASTSLRAGKDELAQGLRALATVLNSGVPTSRALAVLEDFVPPCWLAVLPAVRSRIEQGDSLAAALRTTRLPLPQHVYGIIEAGEGGSGLGSAVESAAALMESRASTNAALWNALSYPILLAITGAGSIALLVGTVLPRFTDLIAETGAATPVMTRLVLDAAAFVRAAAMPAVVGLALAALIWSLWTAREEGLRQWHTLLLRTPGLGAVRRSTATANACSTLSALLRAGVTLTPALVLAARATGDQSMQYALTATRNRLVSGAAFSAALRAENALTIAAVRLVRIGEEIGELAQMLQYAAQLESSHAVQVLKRMIRLLEPAIILVFGGIVLAVAAALLQAIYGLRPSF